MDFNFSARKRNGHAEVGDGNFFCPVVVGITIRPALAQDNQAARANAFFKGLKRLDALPLYENLAKVYPNEMLYSERLVGFDNAHPVGKRKRGDPQDHRHRIRTVKPYGYNDAATLLADSWTEVDALLKERGACP